MDIVESTVKPVENTESSEKTLRFDCEYLLNASQYDRYLENIEKKNAQNHNDGRPVEKDIKFYRKRILHLTKRLLKNECKNAAVEDCFNNYMQFCIDHFKLIDKIDARGNPVPDVSDVSDVTDVSDGSLVTDVSDGSAPVPNYAHGSYAPRVCGVGKIEDYLEVKSTLTTVDKGDYPQMKYNDIRAKEYKTKGIASKGISSKGVK